MGSTTVKVYQNGCGAAGKEPAKQALGKNSAGWITKIHVVADALGLPIHFFITLGQWHDSRLSSRAIGAKPLPKLYNG